MLCHYDYQLALSTPAVYCKFHLTVDLWLVKHDDPKNPWNGETRVNAFARENSVYLRNMPRTIVILGSTMF